MSLVSKKNSIAIRNRRASFWNAALTTRSRFGVARTMRRAARATHRRAVRRKRRRLESPEKQGVTVNASCQVRAAGRWRAMKEAAPAAPLRSVSSRRARRLRRAR
jgi:hypothetical protein